MKFVNLLMDKFDDMCRWIRYQTYRLDHTNVSFIKSLVRIAGGIALIAGSLLVAGVLFIVAEMLGILEEIV
jgi:hypothetical protein